MRARFEAWRRRWRTWTIPLAVVALQIAGLAVYQARFARRNADLVELLERRERELDWRSAVREGYESFLERAGEVRSQTARLYREQFSTEAERFTASVREVKALARRAGLEPVSITYPEDRYGTRDLIARSFVFGVEGTYEQLRTLINLMELSDHFLILRSVSLSGGASSREGGGASRLRIELEIATIFADPEADPLDFDAGAADAPPAGEEEEEEEEGDDESASPPQTSAAPGSDDPTAIPGDADADREPAP